MTFDQIKEVTAGSIIVMKDRSRFLVVSTEVTTDHETVPHFKFIIIDDSSWKLGEPTFFSCEQLVKWFESDLENPIQCIIPENEVFPAIPWKTKTSELQEDGPFLVVLKTGKKIEFLGEFTGEEGYTDVVEEATIFLRRSELPIVRIDEEVCNAGDFLPRRKVSVQGKGYTYNFETNATELALKDAMDYLIANDVGYSDDDLVVELQVRGFYATVISGAVIDPDQILSADW